MKLSIVAVLAMSAVLILGTEASFAYEGIHGTKHGKPQVNFDSLVKAATPLSQSTEGRNLVAECVAAYGGREHLEKLTTLILHYQTISSLSPDSSDLWKYVAPGRKLKKSQRSSGKVTEFILNDDKAWLVVGDSTTSLEGVRYFGQLYNYEILHMPLSLAKADPSSLYYGRRDEDSLKYIYWKMSDSVLIVVGIDPVNKLIMSGAGAITMNGATRVYASRFAHHMEIDTYMLPGLIVEYSLGLELGTSRFKAAEINPSLSDTLFLPDQHLQRSH